MASTRGGRVRGFSVRSGRAALLALATAAAFVVIASAASAARVNVVSQGAAPSELPPKVFYFKTIQAAVNSSKSGDYVLIAPGVYDEEVKVTHEHSGIFIRGMDRNAVIIDGQHKPLPGGSNGIEVFKANNVWIENLTVRNFDRATPEGPNGNEIWWNGGGDTGKIGAHGWYGRYLTAYDTGLNGGYGIFTGNEITGEWDQIYASGFNDSGMYIGACPECKAVVNHATMENNALGYSGSNAGGELIIENSKFKNNSAGIAPNSENPGDAPPPQNGACGPKRPYKQGHKQLPKFTSTEIERCTIIRNNIVEENNNLAAPDNPSTEKSPWGAGIELPGDYADLVESNTIKNNVNNGVLAFEYPNPFPPTNKTIFFQVAANKVAGNTFSGNGTSGGKFAGDVLLAGGLFGEQASTNNCFSGNTFTAATYPAEIEKTWGCQNKTTPNPNVGFAAVEYLIELQEASKTRTPVGQAAPPAQPTMANPCEGVPHKPPVCA
ncbi:MAG TPA: hypothetical protein VG010_07320 [Solirubrobacteraceae bacterium]|jgi:hypothetical protein|nr:hypothetical protein [Solirubrobacteraceae bacterium]